MYSPTLFHAEGKNEGLVVGTKPGDAQALPRVGPLWIFEGRYTAGRVPGWQTAWGSNGSSHRHGRDGHPDSRVREGDIYPSKRAREGWREKSLPGTWECARLRPWTDPFSREREAMAAKMEHVVSVVAERWIVNRIARLRLVGLYTISASST